MSTHTGAATISATDASVTSITRLNVYSSTAHAARAGAGTVRGSVDVELMTSTSGHSTYVLNMAIASASLPHARPVILDDRIENFREVHRGLVAGELTDLREIGHATRHVLEPLLVGLLVRHEHDGGLARRLLFHEVREVGDGDFVLGADVEHLPHRLTTACERDHRAHRAAHPREAARLLAVAEHGDRSPAERLLDEVGHDHPVLSGLARSHGIEEPDDAHGHV